MYNRRKQSELWWNDGFAPVYEHRQQWSQYMIYRWPWVHQQDRAGRFNANPLQFPTFTQTQGRLPPDPLTLLWTIQHLPPEGSWSSELLAGNNYCSIYAAPSLHYRTVTLPDMRHLTTTTCNDSDKTYLALPVWPSYTQYWGPVCVASADLPPCHRPWTTPR